MSGRQRHPIALPACPIARQRPAPATTAQHSTAPPRAPRDVPRAHAAAGGAVRPPRTRTHMKGQGCCSVTPPSRPRDMPHSLLPAASRPPVAAASGASERAVALRRRSPHVSSGGRHGRHTHTQRERDRGLSCIRRSVSAAAAATAADSQRVASARLHPAQSWPPCMHLYRRQACFFRFATHVPCTARRGAPTLPCRRGRATRAGWVCALVLRRWLAVRERQQQRHTHTCHVCALRRPPAGVR